MENQYNNLFMEEVDAFELNGDGAFVAGTITGILIGAGVWVAIAT